MYSVASFRLIRMPSLIDISDRPALPVIRDDLRYSRHRHMAKKRICISKSAYPSRSLSFVFGGINCDCYTITKALFHNRNCLTYQPMPLGIRDAPVIGPAMNQVNHVESAIGIESGSEFPSQLLGLRRCKHISRNT